MRCQNSNPFCTCEATDLVRVFEESTGRELSRTRCCSTHANEIYSDALQEVDRSAERRRLIPFRPYPHRPHLGAAA